jgi:hypothetical protein
MNIHEIAAIRMAITYQCHPVILIDVHWNLWRFFATLSLPKKG